MKLINKISIRFGLVAFLTTLLISFALSLALRFTFKKEVDERLHDTFRQVQALIEKDSTIASFPPYFIIKIIQTRPDTVFYSNTWVRGFEKKRGEEFRQLSATRTINNVTYQIQLRASELEADDFYETITAIVLLSIVVFIVLLFWVNRKVSENIWSDFYKNLEKIKSFSIREIEGLSFKNTGVTEFEELNRELEKMSAKIVQDYKILKQFSEDASHELQTPLAIIRAKVEALLNENELNSKQAEKVKTIYENTNRLSRLNKDLLLLTKLENKQFTDEKAININLLLKEKLDDWQEIIALNKIDVVLTAESELVINANYNLMDIVISNLLSNAINHNVQPNGEIKIFINEKSLMFANFGQQEPLAKEAIFNRFYKSSSNKKSIGLGLSVVKKICENYNLSIDYSYSDRMHTFIVSIL